MSTNSPVTHQKIFQVYLPPSGQAKEIDLLEVFMEESHLLSNGKFTPNYKYKGPQRNQLEVTLYPSFIMASKSLYHTKFEQEKFINGCIDSEFTNMLLYIDPVYEMSKFLEYHYQKYKGPNSVFLKHIEYIILPLIKTKINDPETHKNYPEFEVAKGIIMDWLNEKKIMKSSSVGNKTSISKVKNVVINNQSNVSDQSVNHSKKGKESKIILLIGLFISLGMLVVTILSNWDYIIRFFS